MGRLPVADFLRDFFQKKPLFIPAAHPAFECPIDKAQLFRLSFEEEVESRLVTETDPDSARGKKPYRLREGPFDDADFTRLPARNWTLLVQDVDKLVPKVAALLRWVDFLPRWSVDDIMVSYAAPGGCVGPHIDQYDVFLVQAQGTRIWKLSHDFDADDLREDTHLKVLRVFEPEVTHVARPGDVLYLPAGVAHHGVAEDECMTLSFGFRAPSEAALVSAFCDEMVAEASPRLLRAVVTQPVAHPAEISPDLLRTVREIVAQRWGSLARDGSFLGRTLTEPKPNVAAFFGTRSSSREVDLALAHGGGFERKESSRFLFMDDSGRIDLFVNGEAYPLSGFSSPREFAEHLCQGDPIESERLLRAAGQDHRDEALALLIELAEAGALLAKVSGSR